MARYSAYGLDELIDIFDDLATMPDEVPIGMLNAEADVLVKAQKSVGKSMGVHKTGMTLDSIQKKPIAKKTQAGWMQEIYPKGIRKEAVASSDSSDTTKTRYKKTKGKGYAVRNAEVAFINEFGKKGQPARPFIATANEQYGDAALAAAAEVYDNYLKSKGL